MCVHLPYLLSRHGVCFVFREDIDISVSDQFLRGVGRVGINRRSRRRYIGLIYGLDSNGINQVSSNNHPFQERKAGNGWSNREHKSNGLMGDLGLIYSVLE